MPDIQPQEKREQQVELGIDLTLCPGDWQPEASKYSFNGGALQERNNNIVEFTARIYTKNDGEWEFRGDGEKRIITFTLEGVSNQKGICMNFPRNGNDYPDLFFDEKMRDFTFGNDGVKTMGNKCRTGILRANDNPSHKHHYQKATTKKAVTEATVRVRCEDYGAWGTLKVEADGCTQLGPREGGADCSQEEAESKVKIPRYTGANHIADSADQNAGNADDDDDGTPVGDGTDGDGLTNYEEYRGFIVGRRQPERHIRTEINHKDIFIYDKDGLGLGYFNTTGLTTHFIPDPEFFNGNSRNNDDGQVDAGTQVINFNHGNAHAGEQHGLRLVKGRVAGSGRTFADTARFQARQLSPGYVNRVVINHQHIIRQNVHANKLGKTIAHELGHSVNLKHHGELPKRVCTSCNTPFDQEVDRCPHCRTRTSRFKLEPLTHPHDFTGRVTSGDVDCVMRYDNTPLKKWCHGGTAQNPCNTHDIYSPPPNEAPGTTFCDSATGTGCNDDGGQRNDATAGNCKGQIRVKDW